MKKNIIVCFGVGLAMLGLGVGFNANEANAAEISSEIVADSEVDYEYLITDGGSLTITAEGEIGEIVVESGGTLVVESSVIIESLYIYPGASVRLDGCILSSMIIEYGEGYNAENISLGEEAEIICSYVSLVIPGGSETAEIGLPSVSSVLYDADYGYYFGAWTEIDSDGAAKCLGSFSGQNFTAASSYSYTTTSSDVELLAGGVDTTVDAVAFVTSVNNSAYGTVSESVMYSTIEGFNKEVEVTFSANEGYEVSSIKINGEEVSSSSPYKFTSTKTTGINTFHVDFAEARKVEYTVTTSASEGGSITPSFTLEEGLNSSVTITANDGYEIESLVVNGSPIAITSGLTSYIYAINAVSENMTIAAIFKIKQYSITLNAGIGGTISGSGMVNHGDNAVITISPSEGYKIKTLTIDGLVVNVSDTTYTIENVTANHSAMVEFEKITFDITANASENGNVSVKSVAEYGESIVALITPNDGYIVSSVKVNGSEVDFDVDNGVVSITINSVKANQAIEISYSLARFNITVQTDLGVTANYEVVVDYNGSIDVELTISKGYKVVGITKNGEALDASAVEEIVEAGKITLTNICADVNLVISAEKIVYTITYNLKGGVSSGDNLSTFTISNLGETLSAPSKVGYTFKGWKVGDKIVSALTITEELLTNLTISAEWEEVDLSSTGLKAGEVVGILSGGAVLSGGLAVGAILALKKKKWFD